MKIEFRKTEKTRKELALLIAETTGSQIKYSGVPKCEYTVGEFIVKKDGSLEYPDNTDREVLQKVLEAFTSESGFEVLENAHAQQNSETQSEVAVANIQRKLAEFSDLSLKNLYNIISAKKTLLQKALGREIIEPKIEADYIYFPWTDRNPDFDEYTAVLQLVDSVCLLAKKSQRITAKEKENKNEKYAFRCFLLRLGFIGDKYKVSRKILLKNFEDSSAFKTVKAKEKVNG